MQQEEDSSFLGRGGQGVVAKIQEGSQFYAAKYQKQLRQEEFDIIMNLMEKRPDHIIKIKSIHQYQGHNAVYEIIMELGQENLYQHIKSNNFAQQNLDYKLNFCQQALKGVQEMHELGYFHRDIKPENYILNRQNELKLIDFGLVKQIDVEAIKLSEDIGTAQYMAPEIIQGKSYGPPVDVWALGLIFYLILTQKDFFNGNSIQEIKKQIAQIQQSEIDERIQNEINNRRIQNLLLGMLRIEPRQRISIRNAVDEMSQIIKESQFQKDKEMEREQQIKCNDKKMLEKQQNSLYSIIGCKIQRERNQNQPTENIVVLSEQENEATSKVSQILQKDQTFKQKVSYKIQSQEEIKEINQKKIELEQLNQKENPSENSVVLSEQENEEINKKSQILQKIKEIKIEFDPLIYKENPCKNKNVLLDSIIKAILQMDYTFKQKVKDKILSQKEIEKNNQKKIENEQEIQKENPFENMSVLLNSETEAFSEEIQIFQKKKKEINQKIIEIEQKIYIENPQNNAPDHDSTQFLKDFLNSKDQQIGKIKKKLDSKKKEIFFRQSLFIFNLSLSQFLTTKENERVLELKKLTKKIEQDCFQIYGLDRIFNFNKLKEDHKLIKQKIIDTIREFNQNKTSSSNEATKNKSNQVESVKVNKKKTNNEVEKSKKSFKEFESLRDSEDSFSSIDELIKSTRSNELIESIFSDEKLRKIIENFSKSKKHQSINKLNEELLMLEILIEDYFQKLVQSKNKFDQFFLLSDCYRQYLHISQIMQLQNIIDQNQIQFMFDYLKINQSFNLEDLIASIDFTESKVVQDKSKLDQKNSEKLSSILNLEKKFNKLIVELIRLLELLQQHLQQQVNQNKHINEQFLVELKEQSAINKQDHIAILSKMLTYAKQMISLHEKELSAAQSNLVNNKQDLQLLRIIARLETLKQLNFYWEMLFKQDQSSSENQTLFFDEKYRKQLAMITDQKNPNYKNPKAPY